MGRKSGFDITIPIGKRCATKLPRHFGRLSAQKVVSGKFDGYFVPPTG
jgi:hypothetical protein